MAAMPPPLSIERADVGGPGIGTRDENHSVPVEEIFGEAIIRIKGGRHK
jgi:hypothetical protein